MSDKPIPHEGPCAATPSAELERQIMNSNVPKNEREWWAAREIESLRRWKQEQLTVTAWWQAIDDYIRKSPDGLLGDNVSAIALKWLQQRRKILDGGIIGVLTNVGTMRVGDEEGRTGFFVASTRAEIATIKHIPMYRVVTILEVDLKE